MGKIHDALQRAEKQRGQLPAGTLPRNSRDAGDSGDSGDSHDPGNSRDAVEAPRASVSETTRAVEPRKPRKTRREKRKRLELEREERRNEERRPRVLVGSTSANVTEEYRTLRARIQSLRRTHPIGVLAITSARQHEGKTTTAINLALSFGMDREIKTCLVDADLRTPGLSRVFGPAPKAGLAEVLETDAKLTEALIELPDSGLSVLPVKALPTYPSELLGSRKMADLLTELRSHFELVIIDAPPVLGLPDAVTLVDACDAALFVVGAGSVSRIDVEAALERLDETKLIGTVFNRCDRSQAPYGDYYGYGRG